LTHGWGIGIALTGVQSLLQRIKHQVRLHASSGKPGAIQELISQIDLTFRRSPVVCKGHPINEIS
jgi:hypothetical protein